MRILGIDPGSRITGYGVIDTGVSRCMHVDHGCIRMAEDSIPERLGMIFRGVMEIVDRYGPDELAIEQVFVSRNAASALKLGQARGAAICACVSQRMPVSEYSPRSVKQALVGSGAADKNQVQHMVSHLLALSGGLPEDASDALAIALCHAHTSATLARIPRLAGRRRR